MFMDTLASVQFQDVTRQQIEQVIGGIERLDTHADALAGVLERAVDVRREDAVEPLGKQIEQQFSNYVMDQQRDAHTRAGRRRPPIRGRQTARRRAPSPRQRPTRAERWPPSARPRGPARSGNPVEQRRTVLIPRGNDEIAAHSL
jgi:hypothetical protein